ncbi:MAG: homoserine O-acetyltransferase [Lentisphaeria bacterium]|nr:homoserine O-acetyltransferase [Lentisphaeria bacterium]
MTQKFIVETQQAILNLPNGEFVLASGEKLKEIKLSYETYGALNENADNVVLICPTLTSDAHAAGYHSEDDKQPGWWDPLIGPGKPIDTNQFFVICSNILSGCKGSTGPGSINPETGEPYGLTFPLVTIKDAVKAQKILLDDLGVKHLHSVVGGSLGGMQALEWSIAYPDFLDRCVCVAAGANVLPQALAFDIIARQEIMQDPDWHDGDYHAHNTFPSDGLSRAREIGHVTYLSSASMQKKFGREEQPDLPSNRSKFSTDFQVESYLQYQAKKFVDRFDANSYLYITRMMDMFDLEKEHGSLEKAFIQSSCKYLIVGISSDWLFPTEQQLDIVHALLKIRKPVSYFEMTSDAGHDAFMLEYDRLCPGIRAFLGSNQVSPEKQSTAEVDPEELDRIVSMVDKDDYILDVGSGQGSFLETLKKQVNVQEVCLDQKFEMVAFCMQRGFNALQLDADKALQTIPDDTFDKVLMRNTIQQLGSALNSLKQVIRIGKSGIISFPNFAYYRYRLQLFFTGTLPVSKTLPHEWYDSPNIHLVTVHDFIQLCENHGIKIIDSIFLADALFGHLLLKFGLENIGTATATIALTKK